MKFKTKPYAYQKKFASINSNVIAFYMDMGTGKTRTLLEYAKNNKVKTIVYFCPVNLKGTLRAELYKHIENPSFFCIDGENEIPEGKEIYIFGIESISQSDREYLIINKFLSQLNFKNTLIVIDESDYIKSWKAKRTDRIVKFKKNAYYRVVMTGTPITQYYQDVFMQFKFLDSNIIPYRSYYGFCNRYIKFHDKYKNFIIGSKNIDELMSFISPYIRQIKLNECSDLPGQIYKRHYYEMDSHTERQYRERVAKLIEEFERSDYDSYVIFQAYSDLQKIICSDFTNRFEALQLILKGIKGKTIIYCKYIKEVLFLKKKLNKAYNLTTFTGNQSKRKRNNILLNLNQYDIMIMTYGVGNRGLNLQEFNNTIFYSKKFNYGDREQAEKRTYRKGQKERVIYWDLICSNSLDEKIDENIESKDAISREFKKYIENKKLLKK